MKKIREVAEHEVLDYWRSLEKCPANIPLRTDILTSCFPLNTAWFLAEIEKGDEANFFLLYVPDFGPLSKNKWKLFPAAEYFAENFHAGTYDPLYPYNTERMRSLLEWPDRIASRIIAVSDSWLNGPFTIIDGNHRAILLSHEKSFVGAHLYLGIHDAMKDYSWAKYSYSLSRTAS